MDIEVEDFSASFLAYKQRLISALDDVPLESIVRLGDSLLSAWKTNKSIFIFGNGGSAANANHLANDLIYGVSKEFGKALKITSLSANSAVLTCLANDEGYDSVFDSQLAVLANPGDLAIILSGSGNSSNIVKALRYCSKADIKSIAILGYSGGEAKQLADLPIHVPIDDMQISEDLQLVIIHSAMQWLFSKKNEIL